MIRTASGSRATEGRVEPPPPVQVAEPGADVHSAWAPQRHPAFRSLWLAVLISSIGAVIQTVGAQWLLVDEPNAAAPVALVQTAKTLPTCWRSLGECWSARLMALPAVSASTSSRLRRSKVTNEETQDQCGDQSSTESAVRGRVMRQ